MFGVVRTPLMLLLILAGWVSLQLVPVPPSVWSHLPGREAAVATAKLAGTATSWYPLSLAPGRSWNTLVSLIVPLATLMLMASMSAEDRKRAMLPLLLLGATSLLFGIVQRAGSPDGLFYIYAVTNKGAAVGLLANRNHQAVLLAAMIPIMAIQLLGSARVTLPMLIMLLVAALVIFISVTLTQSRIGFLLLIVSMALTLSVTSGRIARLLSQASGRFIRRRQLVAVSLSIAAIAALPVILLRTDIFTRLAQMTVGEFRLDLLPVYWKMIVDGFPTGIGYGAFERVFQINEPFDRLQPAYLNHAHNDLAEWVMEGGLVGVMILVAFLWWWVGACIVAIRQGMSSDDSTPLAGLMVSTILLLGSLVDYPLRTPIGMVLMAIACGWLAAGKRAAQNGLAEPKN